MTRNRILPCCILVCVAVGLSVGCSRGPSEEELKMAELDAQLAAVQANYAKLQQERADLAGALQTVAEIEAVSEGKRTDEQKAQLEELGLQIGQLEAAMETTFEVVQGELADLLNVALNDFPESQATVECLRMYSDEAIIVAEDMVVQAGDYKKAIDHLMGPKGYYTAIGLTVHQPLEDKLAELDDWRYITQERFDTVKKGMTKDDVMAAVGVPYYGNIQEDAKRGVETWLYRKREGGAAAVYFKMKDAKSYNKKWDAVKTKVAGD